MSRRHSGTAGAVVLVLVAGLWTARHDGGTAAGRPATQVSTAPGRVEPVTDSALLRALAGTRVLPRRPFPGGYDRDCGPGRGCVFGEPWTDDTTAPDGHNGCDTRNDVLREQVDRPVIAPGTHGCTVVGGTLHDPYTGRTLDVTKDRSSIQIDHLVPLAYAWDLGAARWAQDRRERFANDTTLELSASWGPANQSKGDAGPGDWLPVNRSFRCAYVLRYLRVIDAYDLAITADDARSIRVTAHACPGRAAG